MPSGTCSRRLDAGGEGTSLVVAAVTPCRSPWGVAGIGPAAAALWHGGRPADIRWLHAGQAICSESCPGLDPGPFQMTESGTVPAQGRDKWEVRPRLEPPGRAV